VLIGRWKIKQRNTNTGKANLREGRLDKTNTTSTIWADTAYRSKANEDFMEKQGFIAFSSRASMNQSASYPRSPSIHCVAGRLSSKAAAPV